jgi:hypothetical protein
LHTKSKNLPWIHPKPRRTFNENDIEWIEFFFQEVAYQECLKMKDQENSVVKQGKRQQYYYTQEIM